MKAITQDRYGGPDILRLEDVPVPEPGPDQILVRMKAASTNPYDWHMMTGTPVIARLSSGFRRPKQSTPGADGSGIVEAVGADVTEFAPGDEVFGWFNGSFAEYALAKERTLAHKPGSITFEQAAATPLAAITALEGLRDVAEVNEGLRVLVNGSSGGVGTFAVQIAKELGAHVTAVCSTPNVEIARSIGADRVIDYTAEDYTRLPDQWDLIFDIVTTHGVRANRRVMAEPSLWLQAGMKDKRLLSIMFGMLKRKVMSTGSKKPFRSFLSRGKKEHFTWLAEHLETGQIAPVIDRTYSLPEAAEAMVYLAEGHTRGKSVITI